MPTVLMVPLSSFSGRKGVCSSRAEVAPVPPSIMVDKEYSPSEIRSPVPVGP